MTVSNVEITSYNNNMRYCQRSKLNAACNLNVVKECFLATTFIYLIKSEIYRGFFFIYSTAWSNSFIEWIYTETAARMIFNEIQYDTIGITF